MLLTWTRCGFLGKPLPYLAKATLVFNLATICYEWVSAIVKTLENNFNNITICVG